MAYSVAWPATKKAPMMKVRVNHSFIPQRVKLRRPAASARLKPLSGEDAHLASKGTCHEDDRVDERKGEVELGCLFGPHQSGSRTECEVHGEETGEEHQLTGQPDYGSNRNHVRAIQRRVRRGTGGMGRRCHIDIMSIKLRPAQRKPPFGRTFSTKTRIRAEKFPDPFTLVFAVRTSIASERDFSGICTGGRQHLAAAHQRTHRRHGSHRRQHGVGDELDHVRRGHAGPGCRFPRGAAVQGRDRGRAVGAWSRR